MRRFSFFFMVWCVTIPSYAAAQSFCRQIDGARIVAQDGQFLGAVSSGYDDESVFNSYGDFGSKYSDTSILNNYSDYGSKYSDLSPFNQYTEKAPLLVMGSQVIAIISVNSSLSGAVHPLVLLSCREEL